MTENASKRTSKFQVELLRALIVQTVIPIFISFSPCLICWYSPMFGIQLARGFNYLEANALGVFAFVDPVAIIMYNNQKFQVCYFLGSANAEMRQYVRKEIRDVYGADAMDFNMIGALYQEGSDSTVIRSWLAVSFWIGVSTLSIITFFVLARMIVFKLNKLTANMRRKTSNFQVELHRALVVQTVIPILISFSPCVLCWVTPMLGVQLPRGLNYVEVSAMGVFAFVDPIAITLCIPVFRKRIFCRSSRKQKNST
ncbi:unnamed protein product [Caenorhabditis brenneri]